MRSIGSRMGRAAMIVAAGIFLSRALGLVRDMVFASVLGANAATDEYQVAFIVPDFLNYLLAGGYMAITFIPILSRHLADDDEQAGWRAFTAIARPVAIGMTVLVGIGMLVAPAVIDRVVPGFDADQVARAARLTRIVLPAQVFFVVGSLLMAAQYAKEKFFVPTLAPILYNLGIIAGGIFIQGAEPTPEGFAWGVLIGAVVGNFGVQWIGAHRVGLRLRWRTRWSDPAIREYLVLAVPLMLGQSLVVLDELLGRVFGSLAPSDGAITWLQYGRRTMQVPVAIIAQAAGVAAYPYLARLAAEGRVQALAANLGRALRHVIVFSLSAAALLAALALPVIRILYQRGDWTSADTAATAGPLLFFALGIPLWGASQLYARGFYARRQMWLPVVLGTIATLVAIPLYWGMLEAFGVSGLALASTLALAIYTVSLAVPWHRATGWDHLRPVALTVRRALPIATLGGLVAWGVSGLVLAASSGMVGGLLAVGAGTAGFFVAVFAAAAFIFRVAPMGPAPPAPAGGVFEVPFIPDERP